MTATRRDLIAAGTAAAALTLLPAARARTATGTPSQQLEALYREMEAAFLDRSPEHATSLGLDTGARAAARGLLDDRSHEAAVARQALDSHWAERLARVDRTGLSDAQRYDLDVLVFSHSIDRAVPGLPGVDARAPYVVTQRNGAYQQVPDFLVAQHPIETAADADAYLARLRGFATVLDQESAQIAISARMAIIPPVHIIDRAVDQLKTLRDVDPASSPMVRNLATKASNHGLSARYAVTARDILAGEVAPALTRQIQALTAVRTAATPLPGIGHTAQGAAVYVAALTAQTTTSQSAEQLARMGTALVAELSTELDAALRAQGRTTGTVAARLTAMRTDPALCYASGPAGATEVLRDAERLIAGVQARLPGFFRTLPQSTVVAKPVPAAIEAGAAAGYYNPGTVDGSRPGIFYVNQRPEALRPRWPLPSLVYHEAIPGHHMHASVQQESMLPLIRKTLWFGVFNEGWSLYAEQLADEMGLYAEDPLGRIGYLAYALFRAARLVVDTGIHQRSWSRDQAIAYLVDTAGTGREEATSEVDRYAVLPGQACSYMVGRQSINAGRARARAALGGAFSLSDFHDCVLLGGSAPMPLLSARIDRFIVSERARNA